MNVTRRSFLKAAAAAAAAGRITPEALAQVGDMMRHEGGPRVIWLQGAGCDGCAVSFLNSVHYTTVDDLLVNTLDVEFQSNLQAAAGDLAVSAAEAAAAEPGYVLIVEGAIPIGAAGKYCILWPGMNMEQAVTSFAANAAYIVAIGACATYGGVSSGFPNPTEAKGVGEILGDDPRLVNLPACPTHPDWLVGLVVYILTNGHAPPLDEHKRPLMFFSKRIHDQCPNRREFCGEVNFAEQLGDDGCMERLGCKGKHTYSECPVRKWNAGGPGEFGVNWCIGARSPCLGCVNPTFPDAMSPFYVELPFPPPGRADGGNGTNGAQGANGGANDQVVQLNVQSSKPRVEGGSSANDDRN